LVHSIPVSEPISDYIVRLVRSSRPADPAAPDFVRKLVDYGAGTRAIIYLAEAAKAFAAMDGRPSVAEEDVHRAALPVLRHRDRTNSQPRPRGKPPADVARQPLAPAGPREEGKYARRRR